MTKPRISITFLLGILLLGQGCYTRLSHKAVSESSKSHLTIADNCYECHSSSIAPEGILPESAYDDYHWQFYANSAWWHDNGVSRSFQHGVPSESSATWPRAHSGRQANRPETVVTSQPAAVSRLSKKSSSDDNTSNQSQDTRRTTKRRSTHKSSKNSDQNRKSSSRSSRE